MNYGVLAYGDLPRFPRDIKIALELIYSQWQPINLGWSFNSIKLNDFIKLFLMLITLQNVSLALKLYLIAPYLLSFVFMYIFLGRFTRSVMARYVASFTYSLNPPTINFLLMGATGWLYVHALLPIILHSIFNLLYNEKPSLHNALILGMLMAVAFDFGGHAPVLVLPFLLYGLIDIGLRRIRLLAKRLVYLTISLLSFVTLSAGYISVFTEFFSYATSYGVGRAPIWYGHSQSLVPLINMMTLQPDGLLGWGQSIALIISGLTLPLLAFSALLFIKNFDRSQRRIVVFFAVMSTLIISYTYYTYLGRTYWLIRRITLLHFFIAPVMFYLPLSFFYAGLIAFSLNKVNQIIKNKKTKIGTCLVIIFLMLPQIWPVFTGDLGISIVREQDGYEIPATLYEISDWVKKDREWGMFRTQWLPMIYNLGAKVRFVDESSLIIPLGISTWREEPFMLYVESSLKKLMGNYTTQYASLVAPLNVKYIIVYRSTPPQAIYTPPYEILGYSYVSTSANTVLASLSGQVNLKTALKHESYIIYENPQYIPHISVFSKSIYVKSSGGVISAEDATDLIEALASLPSFDIKNHLLLFEELLSSEQKDALSGKTDITVIMMKGSALNDSIDISKKVVIVFPCEKVPTDFIEIEVPQEGQYRFVITGNLSSTQLPYSIDPHEYVSRFGIEGREIFIMGKLTETWYESDLVNLTRGRHLLRLPHVGQPAPKLGMLFLMRADNGESLQDIFDKSLVKKPALTVLRSDLTDYLIHVKSESSAFIYFGEPYHNQWEARTQGNIKFLHIPAFFGMNGFFINGSVDEDISISFIGQKQRQLEVNLLMITWGSTILIAIGTRFLSGKIRKRKGFSSIFSYMMSRF
jgi:hypothetical protein